ncbi:hypothetical protein JFV29_14835 [Peribacillus sp. TH16]|uniref:hypothetical protein n=1 Tax=Peribacillus sp. TH16 TaxID=2798482 RepID=UPI0019148DBA|nr:hypothetical protein [Peribacillus sp. TH16]MBK5483140.1 hypothetical protein [Peribacillus sp. TH16]
MNLKNLAPKKLLWLFIIILFCISGLFFQNYQKQSTMSERASKAIEPYIADSNTSYNNLKAIEMEGSLTELQTKQLEEVKKVGKDMLQKFMLNVRYFIPFPIINGSFPINFATVCYTWWRI